MANLSGTVTINGITDSDMIKIYEYKENHAGKFTFQLTTPGASPQQSGPPQVHLGWTTLEGAEAIVALMKDLQPKTA